MADPVIYEIPKHVPFFKDQCECPKEDLDPGTIGHVGYREKRASRSGSNPATCMRQARWIVDGKRLCPAHAGASVLNRLSKGVMI